MLVQTRSSPLMSVPPTLSKSANCSLDDTQCEHNMPLLTPDVDPDVGRTQVASRKRRLSFVDHLETSRHTVHKAGRLCLQPPSSTTASRPLSGHRAAAGQQVDGCEAQVASTRARSGGELYYASFTSLAHNNYNASFQVLETGAWMKCNSGSPCQNLSLCKDAAKLPNLGIVASDDAGSQPGYEHQDPDPSNRSHQRAYYSEDQRCDTSLLSEPATDAISHSCRTDDLHKPTGTSSCSKEIDLSEVRPAAQYFDIEYNTSSAFAVKLRDTASQSWRTARPWPLLESLNSVQWNGISYCRGDLIYIRSGPKEREVNILEIADIRSLDDSRSVLRGFWFYQRSEIGKSVGKAGLRAWRKSCTYIKSTHTEIIMWDCASGRILQEDRKSIVPGMICDMSGDRWKIRRRDDAGVRWAAAA